MNQMRNMLNVLFWEEVVMKNAIYFSFWEDMDGWMVAVLKSLTIKIMWGT